MKRVLRWAGEALAIAGITLALDYVVTATLFAKQKRALAEADANNYTVYTPAPYHHDLIPNREATRVWGNLIYPWKTDRYGFRTGTCAPGEADRNHEAIFVIGDSFTEALGSTYEDSFVGLMACDAAKQNKAVWNLGVASYSPAIYHHKIRAAAQRLDVKPSEIFVFLDLSDIDDDANIYRSAANGTITTTYPEKPMSRFDTGQFLLNNFTTFRFLYDLYLTSSFSYWNSVGHYRARWTNDPKLLDKWGRRGLATAAGNLGRSSTSAGNGPAASPSWSIRGRTMSRRTTRTASRSSIGAIGRKRTACASSTASRRSSASRPRRCCTRITSRATFTSRRPATRCSTRKYARRSTPIGEL